MPKGQTPMAECNVCGQEMTDGVSCVRPTWVVNGVERDRVRYDPEPDFLDNCHDCRTPRGGLHHPGCDDERCPDPGCIRIDGSRGQAIGCGCRWEGDAPEGTAS